LDGSGEGAAIISLDAARAARDMVVVTFTRPELDALLRIYSFMVGAGEWRDYGIGHFADRAVFQVFKRSGEAPLFRVEKVPAQALKQGAFRIVAADGKELKRGREIKTVIAVFERMLKLADAKKGRF
jgi:hypothetical protein